MTIAILLLAAGNSRRMGTAKQLLPVGSTTLLGHSIDCAIQSNANKIYCILGAHANDIKASIPMQQIEVIINDNFMDGLSSSIRAGIHHINHLNFDAVLIILADQPLIDSKYLNILIQGYIKNPTKILASDYGNAIGVPAIFPKKFFKQLIELKGDNGAKKVLNHNSNEIIKVKCNALLDIDTKEDYLNFLKSL
ncbi:nucleotidyltransferase family protein [uncultured Psychroserpens sp.]|uniref:nucleotidyltransferase family protein n=1 Tax=uncultured Psychroserpens sp. TaxID=255436 RepID=UPI002618C01F|nr:nucleotidyltransferase family protein [uncultured Psychroserpens sp.]